MADITSVIQYFQHKSRKRQEVAFQVPWILWHWQILVLPLILNCLCVQNALPATSRTWVAAVSRN